MAKLVLLLVLGLIVPPLCGSQVVAQSVEKAATTEPADPPTSKPLPYRGQIYSIDLKKKTFVIQNKTNKKTRLFHIDAKTRIELDGKKVKLEDLPAKVAVSGSCRKVGDREYQAVLVRAKTPKSEPQKAP